MPTYLDLVNKVVLESGKEQDLLTLSTWSTLDANRRIYPRIKRLVKEAWRAIQMSRNEWEFNTAELYTTVYPRIKYSQGLSADGLPSVGSSWKGRVSGTVLVLISVEPKSGDWLDGDAMGQMEFSVDSGTYIEMAEIFDALAPDDGTFVYTEKGSYDFLAQTAGLIREPHWTTFVAGKGTNYPNPVFYVPWDNFTYKSYTFVGTSQTAPSYVSQDFEGRIVFYPQPIAPFTISFVYDVAPQELTAATDIPFNIPSEYHDWIAWRALMNLARFDKDPDLFSYAERMHNEYQNRAERNLLPIPSYAVSPFNRTVHR